MKITYEGGGVYACESDGRVMRFGMVGPLAVLQEIKPDGRCVGGCGMCELDDECELADDITSAAAAVMARHRERTAQEGLF